MASWMLHESLLLKKSTEKSVHVYFNSCVSGKAKPLGRTGPTSGFGLQSVVIS